MNDFSAFSELNKARQSLAVTLSEHPWFVRMRTLSNYNRNLRMFWVDSPIPEHIRRAQRRHYTVSTSSIRHRVLQGRYYRETLRQRFIDLSDIPTNPNDPF